MIPTAAIAEALDSAEVPRARQRPMPAASSIWQTLVDAPAISDEAIRAELAEGGHSVSRQWVGSKRAEMLEGLPGVFEMLAGPYGEIAAGLAIVDLRSLFEKSAARRFAFDRGLRLDPGRDDVWLDVVSASDGCYSMVDLVGEAGGAGVVVVHGAIASADDAAKIVQRGLRVVVIFGARQLAIARAFAAEVASLRAGGCSSYAESGVSSSRPW